MVTSQTAIMTNTILSVDNIQLAVLDQGKGDPLLLVHGFPLDHSMWRFQIDALSTRYRVIAPDLRGFGKSDVTQGTVTMSRFADDLANVLDALKVSSAITYCGLSMGGYIGWEFFRRHRQRVSRMIMCDTRTAKDTVQVARGRLLMAARVCAEGPGFVPEAMCPKLFSKDSFRHRADIIEKTRNVILASPAEGIAAAQRGMAQREDVTQMLTSVEIPVLLLVGVHDMISPPAEMQHMANSLPLATLKVVDRSGHLPPLENPDAVNKAIFGFLNPLLDS